MRLHRQDEMVADMPVPIDQDAVDAPQADPVQVKGWFANGFPGLVRCIPQPWYWQTAPLLWD